MCIRDSFGTDYHSHLGTKRGGMAVYDRKDGFQRQIHNIENTPFRTKFDKDLAEFHGCSGIGCISDTDPQPLLVRSHLGLYAITTVGIINNADALVERYFSDHGHQFMAMSSGKVNATELVAALINQKDDLISGIRHAQDEIDGSATIPVSYTHLIGSAITNGERVLEAIAAVRGKDGSELLPPCGSCRQLLADYAPECEVILPVNGVAQKVPAKDLLPFAYHAEA